MTLQTLLIPKPDSSSPSGQLTPEIVRLPHFHKDSRNESIPTFLTHPQAPIYSTTFLQTTHQGPPPSSFSLTRTKASSSSSSSSRHFSTSPSRHLNASAPAQKPIQKLSGDSFSKRKMIFPGSCYCRSIRYEISLESKDEARTSICHCRNCKVCIHYGVGECSARGSAFFSLLFYVSPHFQRYT